jgi:hypothetical protein
MFPVCVDIQFKVIQICLLVMTPELSKSRKSFYDNVKLRQFYLTVNTNKEELLWIENESQSCQKKNRMSF